MIYVKHAPAGHIAQYFTDEPAQYGLSIHGGRAFLKVTGKWCPTREEALASVKAYKAKELTRLRAKLQKVTQDLEAQIAALDASSDEVMDE